MIFDLLRPDSVVLVGHSIGGVLAKSLLSRPGFDSAKVSTVVTLATPHSPVLLPDRQTADFYDRIDASWDADRSADGSGRLRDVTLVSVGGGERDIQVRSGLTRSNHADVSVSTTAIPGAWVSADHRCMAWCKQVVFAVVRSLFDAVDAKTGQLSALPERRRGAFEYHLTSRIAGKRYKWKEIESETKAKKKTKFERDGFWTDSLKRQFVFERTKVSEDSHIMIRIFDDAKHSNAVVEAINVPSDSWIFGCKTDMVYKSHLMCDEGEDLSASLTKMMPSSGGMVRKAAVVDLHELGKENGYTHLVVRVPRGAEKVRVHVDVFNGAAGQEDPVTAGGADLARSYQVQ